LKKKIFSILFALVLVLTLVPASLAFAATGDHTVRANQEQLKLIQELYGKPITMGEYLERVYPDELEKILKETPKGTRGYLYKTKMRWEPLPEQPPTTGVDVESPTIEQTHSIGQGHGNNRAGGSGPRISQLINLYITYYLDYPNAFPGSGKVNHGAKISVRPQIGMPYLWCQSNLWHYASGQGWILVDSVSKWAVLFWFSIEAKGEYETTADGYYFAYGNYMWIAPPPFWPPAGAGSLITPAVYLTP